MSFSFQFIYNFPLLYLVVVWWKLACYILDWTWSIGLDNSSLKQCSCSPRHENGSSPFMEVNLPWTYLLHYTIRKWDKLVPCWEFCSKCDLIIFRAFEILPYEITLFICSVCIKIMQNQFQVKLNKIAL